MTEEKIITRIQKMLALANDLAATEGERDNALRMAYNLMSRYNLDLARVEAFNKKIEEPRTRFQNTGWSWHWAKSVRNIVADMFYCKYFYGASINGTQCQHNYIGRESNAMTAAVMADWVVDSILKEGRKIYKQNTAPGTRAFAIGAMHRLRERVEAIKAAREAEMERESTGTSLVLASHARSEREANALALEEMGITLTRKSSSRSSRVDPDAYNSGRDFGDRIQLNEQVSARSDRAKSLK